MANQSRAHSELVEQVLLILGCSPKLRVWKNHTGVATSFSGNVIRFGLKGSADILGIIREGGVLLAIEIKTGSAVQNLDQKNFQKMIDEFNGVYLIIRSQDEAKEFLDFI